MSSQAHLSELLGVRPHTVAAYLKRGMPGNGRDGYCVPQAVRWMVEQAKGEEGSGLEEATAWLEEVQKERALKLRREREREEGETIRMSDFRQWWSVISGKVRRATEALQRKYGNEAADEIREALEEAGREVGEG